MHVAAALQSAASVFYSKLATGQTAAQWGRTLTTATTQAEHTDNSATKADLNNNDQYCTCVFISESQRVKVFTYGGIYTVSVLQECNLEVTIWHVEL